MSCFLTRQDTSKHRGRVARVYTPGPSLVFNWQPKRKVLVVHIINSRYVTNKSTKEDLQGSNIQDSKFLLHFFLCTFVVLDSWHSLMKGVLI